MSFSEGEELIDQERGKRRNGKRKGMGKTVRDVCQTHMHEQAAQTQSREPDDRKECNVHYEKLAGLFCHWSGRSRKYEPLIQQKRHAYTHQVGQNHRKRIIQLDAQNVASEPVRQCCSDSHTDECEELQREKVLDHFTAAWTAILRPKSILSEMPRSSG